MAASAQTMDHGMHLPAPTPTPTPAAPAMDPDMPMPAPAPAPEAPQDHHDHHPGMVMPGDAPAMESPAIANGSGTSRLPANEGAMHGVHIPAGDWMVMLHGYVWGAFTDQGGPRGDEEAFVQSMAMLSATGEVAPGVRLGLQSMLSLEPLMGAKGYPNLFATGETADGTTHLVDRQHPHDLFMELSGRIDVDVAPGTSLFLYGGPVAEPALGPSAFMHRASAQYLPLAPITHHWFDSTHITYGVVTAGVATPRFQIEASAFRGREPDQYRWNIETPKLDSWSVRATWTPSPAWALQVSHGRIESPEQLEPDRNEARTTASVQYAKGGLSTLVAFSAKKDLPGRTSTAWLAEANWNIGKHHTLFGRAENVANDELFPDHADPLHDRIFRVSKFEGGYAYRLPLPGPFGLAVGGALAAYAKPAALDAAYGDAPVSYTLFAKLSLGQ
ncbi:MAG: hypothetical protein WC729_17930 [Sphingomonas sp.]|uniref:hypothetical protein n=1 Tax=Sphingomonas sp. TaxID=28214 RepID=UPI003563630B